MTDAVLIAVNGTVLPPPSEYSWGLNDISKSDAGRDDAGLMYKGRITSKRTLQLGWSNLPLADVSTVLQAFEPEYITVTYYDLMEGQEKTGEFYRGDITAPYQSWTVGGRRVSKLSFKIIER